VLKFFQQTGFSPVSLHRQQGEAFVEFALPQHCTAAMGLQRMTIGSRYIELQRCTYNEMARVVGLPLKPEGAPAVGPGAAAAGGEYGAGMPAGGGGAYGGYGPGGGYPMQGGMQGGYGGYGYDMMQQGGYGPDPAFAGGYPGGGGGGYGQQGYKY
jgi:hypothetical protein